MTHSRGDAFSVPCPATCPCRLLAHDGPCLLRLAARQGPGVQPDRSDPLEVERQRRRRIQLLGALLDKQPLPVRYRFIRQVARVFYQRASRVDPATPGTPGIDPVILDGALGLPQPTGHWEWDGTDAASNSLRQIYGAHMFVPLASSTTAIAALWSAVRHDEARTVYDLGAGFGKVVLHLSLLTEATCKGIELVGERVVAAERIRTRLDIPNATFTRANVADADLADGDVFYLFSPFYEQTLELVDKKLARIAETKPVTVVITAVNDLYRDYCLLGPINDWAAVVETVGDPYRERVFTRVFRSK